MRKILTTLYIILGLCACETQQEVINTGICSPYFEGTIMEYLRSDDYNWKLTVEMIEQADLTDLFEGKVDTIPEMTFFAPPSYSIERYLYQTQRDGEDGERYVSVKDIPKELCRKYILRHVVKGKYLKKDVAFRNEQFLINDAQQDGGTDLITLGDTRIRAYREQMDYAGVPNAGEVLFRAYSLTFGVNMAMASPDIQPYNGVVHALNYSYDFERLATR